MIDIMHTYFREQEELAAADAEAARRTHRLKFKNVTRVPDEVVVNRETLWLTADGRWIAIKDMADQHLLRTIRVLQERSPHGTTVRFSHHWFRLMWINTMCNEAYRRGLQLL